MQINKNLGGATLTLDIEGRIDTTTAPALEGELKRSVTSDVKNLVLDFAKVEYISSAGLRVLLAAQKVMKKQGSMVVRNVNEAIMEVFEIFGRRRFADEAAHGFAVVFFTARKDDAIALLLQNG